MSYPSLNPRVSLFRHLTLASSTPPLYPITRRRFHASIPQITPQEHVDEEFLKRLLDRRWMLSSPETKVHQIYLSTVNYKAKNDRAQFGGIRFVNNPNPCFGGYDTAGNASDDEAGSFYVVRDDLIHPLINGNKARKLDALLPLLEQHGITDVVTCGGCQSAHTAAVGVTCAERGLNSHLLLRGEQPEILTGYNLISSIYGNVHYVPRILYSKREDMLEKHAKVLAGEYGSFVFLSDLIENTSGAEPLHDPNALPMKLGMSSDDKHKKVAIINEGAGDGVALLGVIRLVNFLSGAALFGQNKAVKLVVDAGTGTTAVGLALGAICLGLPWEVTAIMLADSMDGYQKKEKELISEFNRQFGLPVSGNVLETIKDGVVHWVERGNPRKFGNVLVGEVEACQQIAQQTGISVDPVYTLAAWELSMHLGQNKKEDTQVVMLHTGGTLGMFGLAQRTLYVMVFLDANPQAGIFRLQILKPNGKSHIPDYGI